MTIDDDALQRALTGLHVRVPRSEADAAQLRAEVRAADAALGAALRAAGRRRAHTMPAEAPASERGQDQI
ncbi:hypothetical protein [Microbacterium esteraromaticum]|uniref:hypothetical protein n=1 Tax=Microbacterium esteraromaticum TaxID=57043 RepID=UPI001C97D2E1|nr:hypothetical protein [Microbacterium esteraromaticum]MBY6060041.1 hypothetical protein [Microbacterium esteraromaticum]